MVTKIKIRKQWSINPATKVHSSKKGKKGYKRSETKKIERDSK